MQLYQQTDNKTPELYGEVTLSEGNNWENTFTNLPVEDEHGYTYYYTVEEISVDGYTTNITGNMTAGYMIRNTLDTMDITVNKDWVDNNNDKSSRPDGITIGLYYIDENGNEEPFIVEVTDNGVTSEVQLTAIIEPDLEGN